MPMPYLENTYIYRLPATDNFRSSWKSKNICTFGYTVDQSLQKWIWNPLNHDLKMMKMKHRASCPSWTIQLGLLARLSHCLSLTVSSMCWTDLSWFPPHMRSAGQRSSVFKSHLKDHRKENRESLMTAIYPSYEVNRIPSSLMDKSMAERSKSNSVGLWRSSL